LGIYYPDVGSLAAYLGSFTCLFVIYTLPTLTYIKIKKTAVQNPGLAEAVISDKIELRASTNEGFQSPISQRSTTNSQMITSPKLQRAVNDSGNIESVANVVKSLESERKYDYIKSVVVGILCIGYGLTVFIIQFV